LPQVHQRVTLLLVRIGPTRLRSRAQGEFPSFNRAASSAGRAPRSQRGGREFEPPAVHQIFPTQGARFTRRRTVLSTACCSWAVRVVAAATLREDLVERKIDDNDSHASVAWITLDRTSSDDIKERELYASLDGRRIAILLYGDVATITIAPGRHELRVHNTL